MLSYTKKIVQFSGSESFWCLATWNSQIPAGHIACLKVYTELVIMYKEPLNLFNNTPMFQLQYVEGAILPFVQVSSVEINAANSD